jgi:hypothetical protein
MFLQVFRHRGARPVHEVQINVVCLEVLERAGDSLFDALVPGVVQLGGDPNLFTGNTGVDDPLANLGLVAICQGAGTVVRVSSGTRGNLDDVRVNMAVASEEGVLDGYANFVGLGLPGAQADTRHLRASVQSEHSPGQWLSVSTSR